MASARVQRNRWIKHRHLSPHLRTRLIVGGGSRYNNDLKQSDPVKRAANALFVRKVAEFQAYYTSLACPGAAPKRVRSLVLDGVHLCTTTALAAPDSLESAPLTVSLEDIDVCSNDVEFTPLLAGKNFYTGNLSDFLATKPCFGGRRYNAVYLDFCGRLLEGGENLRAVKMLFERRLLKMAGIIAFTFSISGGPERREYYHETTFGGLMQMQQIAAANGYYLGNVDVLPNTKHHMCTYVCKFINVKDALHKKTGLRCDAQGRAADEWVLRAGI
jgi:hypothetical protein